MPTDDGPLDRYRCEEAFRRMEAYLDRELGPDESRLVAEHLEVCAECAGIFQFEAAFLDEVRAKIQRIQVPPTLLRRVLSRIEEAR